MKYFQTFLLFIFVCLTLSSCQEAAKKSSGGAYSVKGSAIGMEEDVVCLYDPAGDTVLATDTVRGEHFSFAGTVEKPIAAVVTSSTGDRQLLQFFLEAGDIAVDLFKGEATGTPLNDDLMSLSKFVEWIDEHFDGFTPEQQDSVRTVYEEKIQALAKKHIGDPMGLIFTRQQALDMTSEEIDSVMKLCKEYAEDEWLNNLLDEKREMSNTAVGRPYLDFEGKDLATGQTVSLSDFVGQGRPVIVDFWASWCGPCRREIKDYLTAVAQQYKGKCDVVGVAVWEEDEANTLKAMKELSVSWPVIYTGGREESPADRYGIKGIPHIILIDTDGTILARDLRGEAISQAIEKALLKQ